jgi:hypothetical protein
MLRKMILGVAMALMLTGSAYAFGGWEVVTGSSAQGLGTNPKTVYVLCPKGKKILGGGAVVAYQLGNGFPADPNGVIYESEPTGGYNGWQASAVDRTPGDNWAVMAQAICAKVQ